MAGPSTLLRPLTTIGRTYNAPIVTGRDTSLEIVIRRRRCYALAIHQKKPNKEERHRKGQTVSPLFEGFLTFDEYAANQPRELQRRRRFGERHHRLASNQSTDSDIPDTSSFTQLRVTDNSPSRVLGHAVPP
ncbi:hypothetical protein CDD80_3648 [Ophiocordyceps camponoti-rufipedis]|uniref:Uncharacterized protein n=1 Tax=Ophiocordyceps camponoti-rufipedis TaxID=2004952 RepID=A0A2C5Z0Z1_9HYPO|nr:hypothetical protein CDD80_3648 [Ophiocordyceps camponoti-rufipedis]